MTENPDFVVNRVDDHQANPLEGYLPKSGGTVTGDLEVNGTQELNGISVARRTVSATAPGSPEDGDLWVDSSTPAWTNVTFKDGWSNYGSGFQNGQYFKDSLGIVHVRGLIRAGTTAYPFVMPSGYRPTAGQIFPAYGANTFVRVDIHSDGTVWVQAPSTGTYTADVDLSGITFAAGF